MLLSQKKLGLALNVQSGSRKCVMINFDANTFIYIISIMLQNMSFFSRVPF